MEILPASAETIERALRTLARGGVIAHPTETCYGLACDLANPEAVARLFALKRRPVDLPVSALFASVDDAKKYVEWSAQADELARKFLPGPLTIVLPMRGDSPQRLYPIVETTHGGVFTGVTETPPWVVSTTTVGVRLSSHPIARKLVERFGRPLSTTSANLHGKPNPYSVEDIRRQFDGQSAMPDLILDGGTLPEQPPSTVVEIIDNTVLVLRQGNTRVD